MARRKADSPADQEPDFEKAIAELEAIVSSMEEDQLPLEELVGKFEQGTQLLARCESVLATARKRLQTIAARQTAPDPDDDPSDDPSHSPDTSGNADDTDDDDDIRLF